MRARFAFASFTITAAFAATTLLADKPAHKGGVSADAYRAHIAYLASDELGGRGIGEPGIDKAADYIAGEFKKAGLEPAGKKGTYFQPFDLKLWKRVDDATHLTLKGQADALKLTTDYTPLPWSDTGEFAGGVVFAGYGIDHGEDGYDDYKGVDVKGKVVLMLRYEPIFLLDDPAEPEVHSRHAQFRLKADRASDHEAVAVLLVDPDNGKGKDKLYKFGHGGQGNFGIPMFHCTRAAANKLLKAGGMADIETLQKQIEESKKPASAALKNVEISGNVEFANDGPHVKNVLGILRGNGPHADEFVVVGGHYDHLGTTVPMFRPMEKAQIHNGADDNASGSAAVLEAAQLMSAGPKPGRSILFMTFTGEEEGLLGSQHWCRHPTIPLDKIVGMINMDMVGRMRKNILEVGGIRTGGFEEMVERLGEKYGFDIRDGGGGRGPSDHASFYGKNLPVLFLFTGLHKQYHKPDDDVELINAEDGAKVTEMAVDMAYEIAARDARPTFQKDSRPEPLVNPDSADDEPEKVARRDHKGDTNKTHHGNAQAAGRDRRLGVLGNPDDSEHRGLLIGEVRPDWPAAKAGIKVGDRITKINDAAIKSAGDIRAILEKTDDETAQVTFDRDGKTKTVTIAFVTTAHADAVDPDTGKARDSADAKPRKARAANPHAGGDDAEQQREMPKVRLGIAPSYGGGDDKEGFAIEYVVPGGAAAKAGMKDSDRIISIGGHKVKEINSYMAALAKFKPGDETTLVVLRDGKHVDLKVKLTGSQPRGNE